MRGKRTPLLLTLLLGSSLLAVGCGGGSRSTTDASLPATGGIGDGGGGGGLAFDGPGATGGSPDVNAGGAVDGGAGGAMLDGLGAATPDAVVPIDGAGYASVDELLQAIADLFTVEYPPGSDPAGRIMVLTPTSGAGAMTFYGTDQGTAGGVTITHLDSDSGKGVFRATYDDAHMTRLESGGLVMELTHHADGTFDHVLTHDGEVVFTGAGLPATAVRAKTAGGDWEDTLLYAGLGPVICSKILEYEVSEPLAAELARRLAELSQLKVPEAQAACMAAQINGNNDLRAIGHEMCLSLSKGQFALARQLHRCGTDQACNSRVLEADRREAQLLVPLTRAMHDHLDLVRKENCAKATDDGPLRITAFMMPGRAELGREVVFAAAAAGGTPPYWFVWNVDGVSTDGPVVERTWTREQMCPAGTCLVTLLVFDHEGTTITRNGQFTLVDPDPPCEDMPTSGPLSARMSVSPFPASPNETVTFTATIAGGRPCYRYVLDLGDGHQLSDDGLGPGTVPFTYAYEAEGVYQAKLTLTDALGATTTATATVLVGGELRVGLSASLTGAVVGEKITFTASVSGGIPPYTFNWDFDDGGGLSTGAATVDHAYAQVGHFNPTVTVTDSGGFSESATTAVTIETPPEEWVFWYSGNWACMGAPLLALTTRTVFKSQQQMCNVIPYTSCDVMVDKVPFPGGDGFRGYDEAVNWICPKVAYMNYGGSWCKHRFAIPSVPHNLPNMPEGTPPILYQLGGFGCPVECETWDPYGGDCE